MSLTADAGRAKEPLRIAVFASGSGSNFQAIADAVATGKLDVRIELLVCDKPQARVVERAKLHGIETFAFRPKDYASREEYEEEILQKLGELQVELIVLAGYMRIITAKLVEPYFGRMVNIHPSLLPSFPGLNAIGQALEHGVKVTGVSVHYVDGGMDTGPIIAQRAVEIREDDTEETLSERIHDVEHELLPQVLKWLAAGRVQLSEDGRRVRVSGERLNV
jgi:phosphoribosylglycinamide formyltransferase-1